MITNISGSQTGGITFLSIILMNSSSKSTLIHFLQISTIQILSYQIHNVSSFCMCNYFVKFFYCYHDFVVVRPSTSPLLFCIFFTLTSLLISKFSVVFFLFCSCYRIDFYFTCFLQVKFLNMLKPCLCVPVSSVLMSSQICPCHLFFVFVSFSLILFVAYFILYINALCFKNNS